MTARTATITLTPHDSAVFSRSAATSTTHLTASYPQGANLLGWAARRLYEDFEKKGIADVVFHSGKVRFSDAVRMVDCQPAFPNPAILLEPKHKSGAALLGRSAYDKEYNDKPSVDDQHKRKTKVQSEAVKGRLVTLAGIEASKPNLARRLRTAMKGGVAAKEQLFGFQSVQPGQTKFCASIECDDGALENDQWEALCGAFEGTVQIGRGHVTTYGGSYQSAVNANALSIWPQPAELAGDCQQVRLWPLSDTAFVDEYGSPNLSPEAKHFGLDDAQWELLPSESAATSRRVWPWNRSYNSRDMEYSVIEAGSVFTFTRRQTSGVASEPATPAARVGIGQERGFGRIAIIPSNFQFAPVVTSDDPVAPIADEHLPKSDPFIAWLMGRDLPNLDAELDAWADRMTVVARDLIRQAGKEGPSVTQWRNLYETMTAFGESGDVSGTISKKVEQPCWDANFCGLGMWVKTELFKTRKPEEASKYPKAIKTIIDRAAKAAGGV